MTLTEPATPSPVSNRQITWGYAGVWAGDFEVWKDDTLGRKLEFFRRNGFTSTGFGLATFDDPSDLERIAAFCSENDFRILLHAGAKYFDPDRSIPEVQIRKTIERTCELLPHLPIAGISTTVGPHHRFETDPDLQTQLSRLRDLLPPLSDFCRESGFALGIENHADFYLSDLAELCESIPGLGIKLDTGNCFLIGERPVEACRVAVPYVVSTHFKDHFVYPDEKELKFTLKGASLGEGDVGLRAIFTDLVRRHPDPHSIIFQWELVPPKDRNAWDSLEHSWEFVRSLPTPEEVKTKS